MKKRLSLLLGSLYLVQLLLVLTFIYMPKPITTNYQWPLIAYLLLAVFLLSLVFAIANIVCGIRASLRQKEIESIKHSFRTCCFFKFAFIPFFLINFALWAVFVMGTFNPFMLFLWAVIPIGIIYTYLMLLATSAYTISLLIRLKQCETDATQYNLHIVLQLIFVADVVDCIVLLKKFK